MPSIAAIANGASFRIARKYPAPIPFEENWGGVIVRMTSYLTHETISVRRPGDIFARSSAPCRVVGTRRQKAEIIGRMVEKLIDKMEALN